MGRFIKRMSIKMMPQAEIFRYLGNNKANCKVYFTIPEKNIITQERVMLE